MIVLTQITLGKSRVLGSYHLRRLCADHATASSPPHDAGASAVYAGRNSQPEDGAKVRTHRTASLFECFNFPKLDRFWVRLRGGRFAGHSGIFGNRTEGDEIELCGIKPQVYLRAKKQALASNFIFT